MGGKPALSLGDEAAAIASAADRLVDRARGVAEIRSRQGRKLSQETIEAVGDARTALRAAVGAIDALLEPSEAASTAAALAVEVERFQRLSGGRP